jgi:hypothetical protein
MSSPKDEASPQDESLTLAKAFVIAGLDASFSSAARIQAAAGRREIVTWRRARRPEYWAHGLAADPAALQAFESPADIFAQGDERADRSGMRLVAPLGRYRLVGREPAEIQHIMEHPGYEAAIRASSVATGLASFVLDSSFVPGARLQPALSWPLRIVGERDVLSDLEDSPAVQRGLAQLLPLHHSGEAPGDGPRVLAERVEFRERAFDGPVLALRFFTRGQPVRLPERVGFDRLQDIEPVVFLRPEGAEVAWLFTSFVYGLSHNLPVDVAAWQASRDSTAPPPLVVAPRGFLRSARVSDTIPLLQSRLRRLPPDRIVPLSTEDFRRLGYEAFRSDVGLSGVEGISAAQLADLLNEAERFRWSGESDAAEGLIAIGKGVEVVERRQSGAWEALPAPPSYSGPPAGAAPGLDENAESDDGGDGDGAAADNDTDGDDGAAPSVTGELQIRELPAVNYGYVDDGVELPAAPAHVASDAEESPAAPTALPDTEAGQFALPDMEATLPEFPDAEAALAIDPSDAADLYILESLVETAQVAAAAPSPPPRYTNIKILDDVYGEQGVLDPLLSNRTYTLDISIKVSRDGLTKDRADQPDLAIPGQSDTVCVWVVVTDETDGKQEVDGDLFEFDRQIAPLNLPPTGDSSGSATFRFRADPGDSVFGLSLNSSREEICPRIGIRIYHKLNLIDHTQLEMRFEHGPGGLPSSAEDPAIRVIFKNPGKSSIETTNSASAARAVTISISKPDDNATEYRFAFVAGSTDTPGKPGLFGTRKLSVSDLDGFVADFRDILLNAVFGRSLAQVDLSATDRDELLGSLASLGTRIITRVFDFGRGGDFSELGLMLRDALPTLSIIQISLSDGAQDFVFPWQILTVAPYTDRDTVAQADNLWGYRFILEVKRCGDGVDSRDRHPKVPRTAARARVTYARWRFKNEKQHYDHLLDIVARAKVAADLVAPVVESKAEFADALLCGGGDLLYIYAHGHAAAPNTPLGIRYRNTARLKLDALGRQLEANPAALAATDIQDLRELHEQFLKVTRSEGESSLTLSQSEVELTYLLETIAAARVRLTDAPIVFLNTCESAQVWNAVDGSFVGFFLDRGARAVLGTESTIPIVLADVFGRAALESMFDGDSLGAAVHKARWHLLEQHRSPLGLCYCLYGAADARLA